VLKPSVRRLPLRGADLVLMAHHPRWKGVELGLDVCPWPAARLRRPFPWGKLHWTAGARASLALQLCCRSLSGTPSPARAEPFNRWNDAKCEIFHPRRMERRLQSPPLARPCAAVGGQQPFADELGRLTLTRTFGVIGDIGDQDVPRGQRLTDQVDRAPRDAEPDDSAEVTRDPAEKCHTRLVFIHHSARMRARRCGPGGC
jgi:hypothetical protein